MIGKRTGIDFSKHEVIVTDVDGLLIHHLKIPNTICNNIKYINTNGIMAVTGDFGNWIFCREFHPSTEGGASAGYWDEKLEISSQQKAKKYDAEETVKRINEFEETFPDYFGREMNEEEKDWVQRLRRNVDDEYEYIYIAYRDSPSSIDSEAVPFGKVRHKWLEIIYDGFDEMCRRIKEQSAVLPTL